MQGKTLRRIQLYMVVVITKYGYNATTRAHRFQQRVASNLLCLSHLFWYLLVSGGQV